MNELSYFTWNADPIIFSAGFITLRWYALMFMLTFICGIIITKYIFIKENRIPEDVDHLCIYVFIGTLVGARLGHCLFYSPEYYLQNPGEIIQFWKGGLASHGGAFGILTALWLFCKKRRNYNFIWLVDRVVIVVALGGLFIRTGNFFNSEILGKPTEVPWAIIFERIDTLPRHAAQLYEAIIYFSIFIFLMIMYHKIIFPNIQKNMGLLFGLFLTLVFTARFCIEFLKEVQSSFEAEWVLDMGQILSIPFIIAGVIIIYLAKKDYFLKPVKKKVR